MGERNYEQSLRDNQKQEITDSLLDELNLHLKEVERIKFELATSLIDRSDSELHDEQRHNNEIVTSTFDSKLNDKLIEEQRKILEIQTKLSKNI